MRILPGRISSGSIVLSENIPSVSVGRSVIATVLSMPKGGSVLVSMFGKHLIVETTMDLKKGQVLHLKVHALSPKIILKPARPDASGPGSVVGQLSSGLSRLIGTYGEKPVQAFLAREIAGRLLSKAGDDGTQALFVTSLMDQIHQCPQALAYLFIPLADNESRSGARVSVERQGSAYVLHFDIETEFLGNLECSASLDKGMDVEIRTPSEEIAEFLRRHMGDLRESLEPFGVRSIEVVRAALRNVFVKEVDVLV